MVDVHRYVKYYQSYVLLSYTRVHFGVSTYLRGLLRCSFQTNRAMRRPPNVNTSDKYESHAFCIYAEKKQ